MVPLSEKLTPEIVEQILTKLGFSEPPTVDFSGLSQVYKAWCNKVPFDNIRKRIHLAKNNPHPLPGHDDVDFFQGWLRFGVGGTCWAGNAALYALLDTLGFACKRGTATMQIRPQQPPDHGTVSVQCEEKQFLVDASMLHNTPLLLAPSKPTAIEHPAWGLSCTPLDKHWSIRWRPLHMLDGCTCRIMELSVTRKTFRQLNEASRTRSPFNFSLYIRLNRGESVKGISDGMGFTYSSSGKITQETLTIEQRRKMLIEQMGISEEILSRIPQDI